MASNGIKDRVAIIGMGCTTFGEHWDKGPDDLLVEAAYEAYASAGIDRTTSTRTGSARMGRLSGLMLSEPLKIRTSRSPTSRTSAPPAPRRSARPATPSLRGAYDVAMAIGVEKLKDSGFSGLVGDVPPNDGTPEHDRAGVVLAARARLLQEVRPRSREGQGSAGAHRVEEPQERRPEPEGAVPQGGADGEDPQFAEGRRPARHHGLLGRVRRLGGGDRRSRRGRAQVPEGSDLHQGAVVRRRARAKGNLRQDYDFTTFREVVATARDAYQQAGITNPREQISMAEVHDCFTPTELVLYEDLGFSARGTAWKDVLDGFFDLEGELPVNPDGGLKSFGHPIGASGLRMMYEMWLQLRGEAGPAADRATRSSGSRTTWVECPGDA